MTAGLPESQLANDGLSGQPASQRGVSFEHRVRYHETDQQGYLFNSRYLELADVALTEFFRDLGWPYLDLVGAGLDPSVVSATVGYLAPARFDDILRVESWCTRVGRSSFVLSMRISRYGTQIASLAMTYVNVDPSTATSRALPEKVAAKIRASVVPQPV